MYQFTGANEGLSPGSWSLPPPSTATQLVGHEHQQHKTGKAAAPQWVQLSSGFGCSLDLNKVKRNYTGLTVVLMNAAKYMEGGNNSHAWDGFYLGAERMFM